jgi:hypothetical protein
MALGPLQSAAEWFPWVVLIPPIFLAYVTGPRIPGGDRQGAPSHPGDAGRTLDWEEASTKSRMDTILDA